MKALDSQIMLRHSLVSAFILYNIFTLNILTDRPEQTVQTQISI